MRHKFSVDNELNGHEHLHVAAEISRWPREAHVPELLTPIEIVALGIPGFANARVLRLRLRRGEIPPGVAVRVGGRWLIAHDRLRAWIAAGGALATENGGRP